METSEVPSSTESTASFARKLVVELQQAILQHETGAFAGDIEAVHDMRVGIRRLRVAIRNFAACFAKEDRRRWGTNMENLANALGAVRDLDVMIQAMKSQQFLVTKAGTEEQTAVEAFIRRLQSRRSRRLRKLQNYLRSEEYAGFKQEFSRNEKEDRSDQKEVPEEVPEDVPEEVPEDVPEEVKDEQTV
ncbi:MAG: CHAD domain-containing protein [Acidobacteria bacterium]|nr:CHAD domain-containing protein [Acidobacteriota bacterium]